MQKAERATTVIDPIDRTGWPSGPWDDEPDELEWPIEPGGGYLGRIQRNNLGALCGYVGLPTGHPLWGFHMSGYGMVSVHGGVTHAAPYASGGRLVWLVGFDCAHAFDDVPGLLISLPNELRTKFICARRTIPGAYRDVAFVRAEVERLALQLTAVDSPVENVLEPPKEEG